NRLIMATEENKEDMKEEVPELAAFDPTKKKKKITIVLPEKQEEKLVEKTENMSVSDAPDPSFVGLKKKKKKQAAPNTFNEDEKRELRVRNSPLLNHVVNLLRTLPSTPMFYADQVQEDDEAEGIDLQQQQPRYPWDGSDRDYSYGELITRFKSILYANNPLLAGIRKRAVLVPPQVLHEGTKKTGIKLDDQEWHFPVMFKIGFCRLRYIRQPEHVMTFFLVEMGTTGALDGQQRLVVKGRFNPKNFDSVLRNEYVLCTWCKSGDTILARDQQRLLQISCEQ
ncbi:Eukaryotic translation initiation factor 2 subunit beta-like protein, partial [Drosera capensis]